MSWQETATMIGIFALRIAIPLLITLGIGELISRLYAKRQPSTAGQIAQPGCEGYELQPQCWEVVNCDPAMRESCPAYLRPQIPCWLALQVAGRDLPEECFSCEVFHRTQSVVAVEDVSTVQGG